MRVASIAKCDHNSKFVSLPVDHLYIVPKSLDSAEVAALFSFYLPAFQALHHGRSRPYRYSKSCLKGKKILVTGGNRLEAQALLRLARLGGATELYVTAPLEYHPTLGKIEGVHLLEDFPKGGWLPTVRGQMDLVIDYEFPKSFKSVRKSLTKKGRLVCIPAKKSPLASSIYEQYRIASMKRASLFDFNHCFENALEDMHKDVKFLLRQLAKRQVRPSIDRFVKLSDLPRLCDTVQGCALSGAVVCEPRKE
jgi:NADPH:quinone reductase-like Zn-dependent oxidoreductase